MQLNGAFACPHVYARFLKKKDISCSKQKALSPSLKEISRVLHQQMVQRFTSVEVVIVPKKAFKYEDTSSSLTICSKCHT